jgi:hypothetical protein
MRRVAALACVLAMGLPWAADAKVCAKWGAPGIAGVLDGSVIDEASGLEASARFPGRLYHNNDSGDDLRFFITDLTGAKLSIVNLKGPKPTDIEEMSLGPCGKQTCLYLGDIGDNPASRPEVAFTLVVEKKDFDAVETPLRVVRARYPDGPHNAEAFAVTPRGEVIVVTKPADRKMMTPGPAQVFKLSASQLAETEGVQVFTRLGEIDLPKLLPDMAFYAWIPTGLDISADGKRALLLTYGAILELDFDLSKAPPAAADWKLGETWQVLKPPPLQQQEAIAWLPGEKGMVWDTETGSKKGVATLMKMMCEAP